MEKKGKNHTIESIIKQNQTKEKSSKKYIQKGKQGREA